MARSAFQQQLEDRPYPLDDLLARQGDHRRQAQHIAGQREPENLAGDETGVCARLEAAGLKLAKFSIRDRSRALVNLRFDALPSRYSELLMIPQNVTEEMLAARYRSGRLLLVGDAAHVHSPAGGQGMNTGLVDAVVLGRMLAEVLAGRREDVFLDAYQALRRPAAVQVLGLAGRLTRMATMRRRPQRIMRNLVLSVVNRLPFARRRLEMALSGLSRSNASVIAGLPQEISDVTTEIRHRLKLE